MATAKKLPSGAWRTQAKKTINGKKVVKSFTVHPKECGGDSRKAKALSELAAREWQTGEEEKETLGMTVSQALDSYIEDRTAVLSPSTILGYMRLVKYFDEIKDIRVIDVDTPSIQKIINEMALSAGAKTIKNRINFLLSVLDYAGNEKKFKLRYPQKAKRSPTTPDNKDISLLLHNSKGTTKAIICLAAFGTLRRGEIAALKQKDVSRKQRTIHIHADTVKGPGGKWYYKELPKTSDSIRTVKLYKSIINLLPVSDDPESFVFGITPTSVARRFEGLRTKLKIKCRFHDLRSYAASFRSDLGIVPKYIEEAGGWRKDSSVLAEVYDNTLNSTREKYNRMIDDFIEENFGADLS